MTLGKRGAKPVSPERCFMAWHEAGDLTMAVQRLANQGILGRNGKPLHFNTVRRSAFLYILREPEKAREVLKGKGVAVALNDDLWMDFLIRKAKDVLLKSSIKSFYFWLVKMNLIDEAKRFGYVPPDYSEKSFL